MKNLSSNLLGVALSVFLFSACANETPESVQKDQDNAALECVFSANGFLKVGENSRTSITPQEETATFAWTEGDIIGVLPDGGSQVYFTIQDIDPENTDKATFSGGAWGLKADNDYAAYYPFIQDIMLDRTNVPVDYTGQTHKGNKTIGQTIQHLASYDYMAAQSIQQESGNLAFQFAHLGALVEVKFTVPEAGPVNRFILTSSEAVLPVKGSFDLTASPVAIASADEDRAYSLTVNVEELVTTTDNQEVSVFFMIPPMPDVSTNTLEATVFYGEENISLPLKITTEKFLEAGKYYTLETELITDLPGCIKIIAGEGFLSSNPLVGVLYNLGGTKLRFITESSFTSQNVVFTDNNNVKAYATRNGDWLEVHTIAKEYELPVNCEYLFCDEYYQLFNTQGFNKLTEVDLSKFDTSNVTSMSCMFKGCNSLQSLDLSNFNTSGVIYMRGMFEDCALLTSLDLSEFDTSNVISMESMFAGCSGLTSLDLSNFDTSEVSYMISMFSGCGRLASLKLSSSFKTSEVFDMRKMFSGCSSLTSLDLSSFDTSNVTNMSEMFSGCWGLTSLDLSNFNTSKVTNMSEMFLNCSLLTSLDLSNFDTSWVTNMSNMFEWCYNLRELDLSSFVFTNNNRYPKEAVCTYMFNGIDGYGKNIFVSNSGKSYLEGLIRLAVIGLQSPDILVVKN